MAAVRRVGPILIAWGVACGGSGASPDPAPPPPSAPESDASETSAPEPAASVDAPAAAATTPNAFLAAGTPTFVVGTAGDARRDRNTRGQAEFVGGLFFPDAAIVDDTSIDTSAGASAWPAHAVLYGGPHVHTTLAALGDALPLSMTADRLEIGGQTFEGPAIQLVTVVPAVGSAPSFLLYAGTGDDGVAEINALTRGGDAIVVGDAFGVLTRGTWTAGDDGRPTAELQPLGRRIQWRTKVSALQGGPDVTVGFPRMLDEDPDDETIAKASVRALERAIERLGLTEVSAMTVYVYPDPASKKSLTGNAGAGHASPAARALHVVRIDAARLAEFESLVVHEGTHLLLRDEWGAPGTPWFGEGVAVWAANQYGGKSLDAWKKELEPEPAAPLMGKAFFSTPEAQTYPRAGLYVGAAIATVGLARVRDHLFRASPGEYAAASKAAGTSVEALDAAAAR